MHKTSGLRDPAAAFPLPHVRDDTRDRREANRPSRPAPSAWPPTGLIELLLAVLNARARWTGRTLRVEIEGWVDPDLPVRDADALGRRVATALARQIPEATTLTWTTHPTPTRTTPSSESVRVALCPKEQLECHIHWFVRAHTLTGLGDMPE